MLSKHRKEDILEKVATPKATGKKAGKSLVKGIAKRTKATAKVMALVGGGFGAGYLGQQAISKTAASLRKLEAMDPAEMSDKQQQKFLKKNLRGYSRRTAAKDAGTDEKGTKRMVGRSAVRGLGFGALLGPAGALLGPASAMRSADKDVQRDRITKAILEQRKAKKSLKKEAGLPRHLKDMVRGKVPSMSTRKKGSEFAHRRMAAHSYGRDAADFADSRKALKAVGKSERASARKALKKEAAGQYARQLLHDKDGKVISVGGWIDTNTGKPANKKGNKYAKKLKKSLVGTTLSTRSNIRH